MGGRAPYSRVYWSIIDDPKFERVYDHDGHLASWLRLLLVADQAYPAPAHLPAGVRKSSVALLAEVELIDLMPGSRYRVHGLEAERERRRLAATTRHPFGHRTVTKRSTSRSPNGFPMGGLSRGRDETSLVLDEDVERFDGGGPDDEWAGEYAPVQPMRKMR